MSTTEQLDIFTELAAIDHTAATQHLPRTFTTSDQYTAADLNDAFAAWKTSTLGPSEATKPHTCGSPRSAVLSAPPHPILCG